MNAPEKSKYSLVIYRLNSLTQRHANSLTHGHVEYRDAVGRRVVGIVCGFHFSIQPQLRNFQWIFRSTCAKKHANPLNTQFVPRSKHFISVIKANQFISGKSRCLFSDKYKTHKYSVGRTYSCPMLHCWYITWPVGFKRLKTKRRLLLKTQFVPRSKHFSFRL